MTTTTHKQTRIEYSKYFLTGILAGLSVRVGYTVPAEDAAARMAELQKITRESPAKEYGSKDATFYVYNVGSIWLEEGGAR